MRTMHRLQDKGLRPMQIPKFGGQGRKKPFILRNCSGMTYASDEGKMFAFAVHTAIIL